MGGVTGWPKPDDPRDPCFCTLGFKAAKPAPWKFLVVVEDATGCAAVFNGSHLVVFDEDEFEDGRHCVWLHFLDTSSIKIEKYAGDLGPPPPNTITWLIQFDNPTCEPPLSMGQGWSDEYPEPDAPWPDDIIPGGDEELWPTPVTVRAVPHDYQL